MIPWKSWDPWILFSWINTKLRDQYGDLSTLCEEEQIDPRDLIDSLQTIHCRYDETKRQLIQDTQA